MGECRLALEAEIDRFGAVDDPWAPAIGAGSANRGIHPESAWLLPSVFVAVRRVPDRRLPVQAGRASGYRPAPAG